MRLKPAPSPAAAFAVAGLILAGWAGSVGLAGADPEPAPTPKTAIDSDGTYAVGIDIAPGTYSSAGPSATAPAIGSGWVTPMARSSITHSARNHR